MGCSGQLTYSGMRKPSLTPARIIHIIVNAASLMTIEQKRDKSAPMRAKTRNASCVLRACLTLFLVLWCMGVHVDTSKLLHYKPC